MRRIAIVFLCVQTLLHSNQWTPQKSLELEQIKGLALSPDERELAFCASSAVDKRVCLVDVTSGTIESIEGASSPSWGPEGELVYVVSGKRSELHLVRKELDGKVDQKIAELAAPIFAAKISPDGSAICVSAQTQNLSHDDVIIFGQSPQEPQLWVIEKENGGWTTPRRLQKTAGSLFKKFTWAPDSQSILVSKTSSAVRDKFFHTQLVKIDRKTGTETVFGPRSGPKINPMYSPDGSLVAAAAIDPQAPMGFSRILILDKDGNEKGFLASTPDSKPYLCGWSKDGKGVFVMEIRGTKRRLSFLSLDPNEKPIDVDNGAFVIDDAVIGQNEIFFAAQTLTEPAEVFVSQKDTFIPRALSSINAVAAELALPKTTVLTWKSEDGLEIEGLLTLPEGKGPFPLLVILHGGPDGAFIEKFLPTVRGYMPYPVAVFAQKGYAVLRPNVRGSSGYGMRFRMANLRDFGGGDYRDVVSGIEALVAQNIADKERVGVMGWSYGGYLASWTMSQSPLIKAASVGAGISNAISFTGSSEIPSFLPKFLGVEFWEDEPLYRSRSPVYSVPVVHHAPTLIQHGTNDGYVPTSQSLELYTVLQRIGETTQLHLYPKTGHRIEEPKLLLDAMEKNVAWFEHYLTDNG